MGDIFVAIEQTLTMLSGEKNNPSGQPVDQLLSISQHVHVNPYIAMLSNHLALVQHAQFHRSIYNISVSQSLHISESADTKPWQRIIQSLLFNQRIGLGPLETIYQVFKPIQVVTSYTGKNVSTIFVPTQTVKFNISKVIHVGQSLQLRQGSGSYKIGTPYLYVFATTHGPNDNPEVL